ncbi:ABC transporter ATP-binding protein [Streptomyces sp. NPDC055299]
MTPTATRSPSRMAPPDGAALPVATLAATRRAALRLIRLDGRAFALILVLNSLAAGAGLAGPWLLGRIVDTVRGGGGVRTVDRLALVLLVCALVQLLLARYARYAGHRFGERTVARVRERFADRTLALPAATVERAGSGDLTTRGTTDIASVAWTLRDAVPEVFLASTQVLFLLGAVVFLSPLLGLCGLGLLGGLPAVRWYLRRAHSAYLVEGAATSALAEQLAATAAGARTVEALGLQERRRAAGEGAVARCRSTRTRTLFLRSVLLPTVDVASLLPLVGVLLVGGVLQGRGAVSLGTVVSAALYLRQLSAPLETILFRIEQLQSSGAAFARVEGLGQAPRSTPAAPAAALVPHPSPESGPSPDVSAVSAVPAVPADDRIDVTAVHYAYGHGHDDVLRGVDLTVRPGERLAVVGPSGAGKSTLGRLLAGVDAPRSGSVTVGGAPVAALDPEVLRRQIVLVTQEHHVFLGTVRDNLRLAAPGAGDAALHGALAAVGADWAAELPDGLDTALGAGGQRLDGAQSQQLALARVVLADPHTLILDEATALLDPRTARHTERALAAVLQGRTVIAIAHRLHTAHDADRVAVMEGGRLTELGSHDELVAADGAYAALWHSWHGRGPSGPLTPGAGAGSGRP